MSTYALVEDGIVTYIGAIPSMHKNISGFDKICDDEVYKTYSFYPYEYIQGEYNGLTQKLGLTIMDIQENKVIGTREIIAKSQEEIDSAKNVTYKACLDTLKEILYATDWTHAVDSGLTPGQLSDYTGFRASIKATVNGELGKDSDIMEIDALRIKIESSMLVAKDRKADMPQVFATLKIALDELI